MKIPLVLKCINVICVLTCQSMSLCFFYDDIQQNSRVRMSTTIPPVEKEIDARTIDIVWTISAPATILNMNIKQRDGNLLSLLLVVFT